MSGDFLLIGEIKSVFGNNGSVLIKSYSDFPERFQASQKVLIDFFDVKKEFIIEDSKAVKESIVVKFINFDNEEDAFNLVGKKIYIAEELRKELDEGVYYVHDLIGSSAFINGLCIGTIEDVYLLPSNDVYVIRSSSGEEILIPAIKDYIERFDEKKKILFLKSGSDNIFYEED